MKAILRIGFLLLAVAAAPAAASAVHRTPAPQFVSLLFGGQIRMGGPPLGSWEKALLLLAYLVLLEGLSLGGLSLSLAYALSGVFTVGCSALVLLLLFLFGRRCTRWQKMTITRRGQARPLRRATVLLLSLAGLLSMLSWLLREVSIWKVGWFLHPPAFSLVVYLGLAYCSATLIQALLA